MKKVKVLGLCLVVMLSSVSVFANNTKGGDKAANRQQRYERIVSELNLNEKQATEFKKIESEFAEKMSAKRDEAKVDGEKRRSEVDKLRDEKNADIKKILSDEQYKKYESMSQRKHDKGGKGMKKDGKHANKQDKKGGCCSAK